MKRQMTFIKYKRKSYYSDPEKDEKVTQFCNRIQERKSSGVQETEILSSLELGSSDVLTILKYILSKSLRNPKDLLVIKTYLFQMEEFQKLFFDKGKKIQSSDDLIQRVAVHMKYELETKRKLLFRYGEKGDKFYIILRGEVKVLLPNEEETNLNFHDYFKTLIILHLRGEIEVVLKMLSLNKETYNLSENEITKTFELFQALYLLDTIEEKKDSTLYQSLRSKVTTDKYINLGNQIEVQNIIIRNLVGYNITSILSKRELYGMFKFYCEVSEKYIATSYITVEEYLNITLPYKETSKIYDPKVKYLQYFVVTTLSSGNMFGEVALGGSSSKRTASVIVVSDEIHLGTISKGVYEVCLRNPKNKIRYQCINFFLSYQPFKDMTVMSFERIFNYFVLEEFCRGSVLFNKGDELNKIYFIKEGEIDQYVYLTLFELNHLIVELGGTDNYSSIMKEKYNKERQFKKFKVRIGGLANNEIVGLENYIYHIDKTQSQKYLFDCEVKSSRLVAYSITRKYYEIILNDHHISNNAQEYTELKRGITLKRLEKIFHQLSLPPLGISNNLIPLSPQENSLFCKRISGSSQKGRNEKKSRRVFSETKFSLEASNMKETKNHTRQKSNESVRSLATNHSFKIKKNLQLDNIGSSTNSLFSRACKPEKEHLRNRIEKVTLFAKSYRTKKIIVPKLKGSIGEIRVKYYNNLIPYVTERKFLDNSREEVEFRKLMTNHNRTSSCLSADRGMKRKNIIDMLIVDRWKENNENKLNLTKIEKVPLKKNPRFRKIKGKIY